jgi:hypothetical protein
MALRKRVIDGDEILCELYADNFSDMSDEECESVSVYSDVATTSAGKQSQSRPLVFTSDSDSDGVDEDESSEPDIIDHSGDGKSDLWCKADHKPRDERFLGFTGLNVTMIIQSLLLKWSVQL